MEDPKEVSEGLSDWEEIQSPWPQTRPKTQTAKLDEKLVIRDDYIEDQQYSIFPPMNHEGLPISPPPPQDNQWVDVSTSPEEIHNDSDDAGGPVRVSGEIGKHLRLRLGVMSSTVCGLVSKIRNFGMRKGTVRSFGVLAALLVLVAFSRWQRWWRRVRHERKKPVAIIIKEKDEKISQLLLQIAQMNDVISTRRRVPVFRVS